MREAMKKHGNYMKKHNINCGCSNAFPSDYAIATDLDLYFGRGYYTLKKRQKAIDNIIEAIREA